jgi:hypothetical protein
MEETAEEVFIKTAIAKMEGTEKVDAFRKFEHDYYWRRLINASYFKQLKMILVNNEYN